MNAINCTFTYTLNTPPTHPSRGIKLIITRRTPHHAILINILQPYLRLLDGWTPDWTPCKLLRILFVLVFGGIIDTVFAEVTPLLPIIF
jgi:hypothetical protein